MMENHAAGTLLQRIDLALTSALRNDWDDAYLADGRIREPKQLLIKGVADRVWPVALERVRLDTPHSSMALVINSFFPWQKNVDSLPLGGKLGFDAIQFNVRCPTGLRGTPPHLDLMALRDDHVVGATVRAVEYLKRKKSSISTTYDRTLGETPGMSPWGDHLEAWRAGEVVYAHVDLAALVKYATALGRTFPDRTSTLIYLYWEPLDAASYDEFRDHRRELASLAAAVEGARVEVVAESFDALWQRWLDQGGPDWLAAHVERLRSRYAVSLVAAN
ncbi:MAG: hypothetical protein R3F54_20680 [Alphaproteobacteria bacterium]